DIYDALTAADRPYKAAVAPARALDIMVEEVRAGQLDQELFRLFVDAKVFDANTKRTRSRTATINRNTPNARRNAASDSVPASFAPIRAPTNSPAAMIAAYGTFTWPRRWYSSAPSRPTGSSSAASDVPLAVCWGSLATSTSPGMITIAPPTPNKPDTTPATRPITPTSSHVIAGLLVQVVPIRPRPASRRAPRRRPRAACSPWAGAGRRSRGYDR